MCAEACLAGHVILDRPFAAFHLLLGIPEGVFA
jgi:hypothetical protein